MKNILVLCTGNSCRSQMAEAYLRFFSDNQIAVYSAGIEAHGVNPLTIRAMQDDGIDISSHRSKTVDELRKIHFDIVITVCDNAKERCPNFPSHAVKYHQDFSDPAKATGTDKEIYHEFKRTRDEIKNYCRKFMETLQ